MPAAPSLKVCPQCGEHYTPEHTFCSRDGSSLRSPDSANPFMGSVLAGRYHVLSKLGEGGMGQVYLAEHVNLKNRVAVKVIQRALLGDSQALARFTREARNASSIAHPHVATVFDFGEA